MKLIRILIISNLILLCNGQILAGCVRDDSLTHPPLLHYKGITRVLTDLKNNEGTVDSLLSIVLEDKLPINVYDGCYIRIRMQILILSNGNAKVKRFFGKIPAYLQKDINRIINQMKFIPAKLKGKNVKSEKTISILLDLTTYPSSIRKNLLSKNIDING